MRPFVLVGITALVFVGVLLVGSFFYWSFQSRTEQRARSIARRIGSVATEEDDELLTLNVRDPLVDALGSIGRNLEGLLVQANVEYTLRTLIFRMAAAGGLGALVLLVITRSPIGLVGMALGIVPVVLLNRVAGKRRKALSEQLPDALDLVGRSLQAGHGLSDAMRLCAEEMPSPVAEEFGRVYEEHNLGRDLRDCLNTLSVRNPGNFDLKIFVSSVMLQRDTGGNLIEILTNISNTVRDRFVFKAKVRALTAEARFSAFILAGLPFVLLTFIMVLRPSYLMPLIESTMGHWMMAIAIGSFSLGVVVMKTISTVDT